MKNLIQRFFKKEPEFSYIIAEYTPVKNRLRTEVSVTEYNNEMPKESDEMMIDKIYQNS